MKRNYHTIEKQGKVGERKLAEFVVASSLEAAGVIAPGVVLITASVYSAISFC